MPRTANVTYEQVAAIANNLVAEGIRDPSARAIRDALLKRAAPGVPTGSPNSIQKHLEAWRRQEKPAERMEAPQLPAQLASDLARALSAAATVAEERCAVRQTQLQDELNQVIETGEQLELQVEHLSAELAARTTERDGMAGQLADRTAELAEAKASMVEVQRRAELAERELGTARADVQAANGRIDEIRQATERQLAAAQQELAQSRSGEGEARKLAAAAELRAVAAEAHLESERNAMRALEADAAELRVALKQHEADAVRAGAAEATVAGLRGHVTLLEETITTLRAMLPASHEKSPEAGDAEGSAKAPKARK